MRRYGVLVISHGSQSGEWVKLVDQAVEAAVMPEGLPVVSVFLEIVEGRLIQEGIDALEAEGVTDLLVIPLFVSSGSTHVDEIAYALGAKLTAAFDTDLTPFRIAARVHYGDPIDDDPDVALMLYDNIRRLSSDPSREAVLVIGHGSDREGFCFKWRDGLDRLAARLQELGGFAEAHGATLLPDGTAETLARWRRERPDDAVLVAPLFLSEGYFTERVIPSRLAGYDYRYNGRALLPNERISRWIGKQAAALLRAAQVDQEGVTGD